MSEVVISLKIDTGFVGCVYEEKISVDRKKWASLSEERKTRMLDALAVEYMHSVIECEACVAGGEDDE